MLKLMLICCVLICCAASTGDSNPKCNCDGMRLCLEYQRTSDILIAIAYLCIPIELIYFVSCSNVPFKWVLFQLIALMVLCGLTHFLNLWTYGPHTFRLSLALTVSKMLTALVSCATAITLFNLFPLLLKLKVRDLDREVGDNQETK